MYFSLVLCHMSRGLGYPTARMSPGLACGWASSFISLRGTPQPSASQALFARNFRTPQYSAQESAGVSRSEIKEEPKAGDIRGGSRPLALGSGAVTSALSRQRQSTKEPIWAN